LPDLSEESLGLWRWLFAVVVVVVVLAGATVGGLSSFSSGRWVEFLIEQLGWQI
jgi:anti-sigma-K factor RskA